MPVSGESCLTVPVPAVMIEPTEEGGVGVVQMLEWTGMEWTTGMASKVQN